MQTTTNYGLKTYEGTDLFNPLTVENVNTETLDTVVKAISDRAVGIATELKTGTVHALSRLSNESDRNVFTFTATSAFTAGDTFTLDGEQMSALTVSGEQLSTGCYIIGSTVLVAKRDTLLTFFVAETTAKDSEKLGGELPTYYATASALATISGYVSALQTKVGTATLITTAQDCSGAINELKASELESLKSITTPLDGWGTVPANGELTVPKAIPQIAGKTIEFANYVGVGNLYCKTFYYNSSIGGYDYVLVNTSNTPYVLGSNDVLKIVYRG